MAKTPKKPAKKTTPKKRANKYDEKLKINGSFEDVIKAIVTPKNQNKKKIAL